MTKNLKVSSFVAAALPSVQDHIMSIFSHFPEYATHSQINNFLHNNVNKFLSSIGIAITRGKKFDESTVDKYVKMFDKIHVQEYIKDCMIYIDSGGYSIQMGDVPREHIPKFIEVYNDYFLRNQSDKFQRAFTLDLAPGYVHCPYHSWKDLEELNILSYQMSDALPPKVRDKMIYIHHFRTPRLYKIYKKMFYDLDIVKNFKHFGTGGLVSMRKGTSAPPCVLYVVPLVDVLINAKKNKLKQFSFHALGETEFKSILTHCFFERHIKEVHDIDINITYDSSSIFKIIGLGRYTFMLDEECLYKLDLRSTSMKDPWRGKGIIEDVFYDVMNKYVTPFGMKATSKQIDPMYVDDKFNKLFYTYGIFQMFGLFKEVQELCMKIVDDLYPLYQARDILTFNNRIEDWMIKFNNGKDTKIVTSRTNVLINTLDIITDLDTEYTSYLVDHFMSAEENEFLPENHDRSSIVVQKNDDINNWANNIEQEL